MQNVFSLHITGRVKVSLKNFSHFLIKQLDYSAICLRFVLLGNFRKKYMYVSGNTFRNIHFRRVWKYCIFFISVATRKINDKNAFFASVYIRISIIGCYLPFSVTRFILLLLLKNSLQTKTIKVQFMLSYQPKCHFIKVLQRVVFFSFLFARHYLIVLLYNEFSTTVAFYYYL